LAPLAPPKKTKAEMKKDLEDKIVELEGKLSDLSNMLGKESTSPITAKKHPQPPPPPFSSYYGLSGEGRGIRRISVSDDLDPDGSAKRQLLAIAERNYQQKLNKSLGTLPKGFGVSYGISTFSSIMSYDKKYAKFLFKQKRCLGCKKQLDGKHILLCHECANDKLSEMEFSQVIRKFTNWGFYKKPILTKIALKLKLAKVVTEQKK